MTRRQLRVFPATAASELPTVPADVSVRLGDLLPLIASAQRQQFAWLHDFVDDEVRITNDLYEVLQAFRAYRPSA